MGKWGEVARELRAAGPRLAGAVQEGRERVAALREEQAAARAERDAPGGVYTGRDGMTWDGERLAGPARVKLPSGLLWRPITRVVVPAGDIVTARMDKRTEMTVSTRDGYQYRFACGRAMARAILTRS